MKTLMFVILALFISTSAFAFGTINGSTTIGSMQFNVSNGVWIQVGSNITGYTVEALHAKGSRVFLTDQVSSRLYWKDASITLNEDGTIATGFHGVVPTSGTSEDHGSPSPSDNDTPPWKAL